LALDTIADLLEKQNLSYISENTKKIPKNIALRNINTNYSSFGEAENKTLLLFVSVKQENYDSSLKQVKIIGFLFSTFRVSRKNKFMLSCVPVRVQIH
jgi:hypothetical protein